MKTVRFPVIILFAVGFLIYVNSLFNSFVWEDWEQLANNPLVESVQNIPSFFVGGTYFESESAELVGNFYRPVLTTYWAILTSIFGKYAAIFHLAQVLIHISNAVLIFYFFRKFLTDKISLWLSLIFLVHPINTEAVAYIASTTDPLHFLFGMLGLLLLSKNIWISGIFLLLSIFTKESGISFFIIYALYSFLFLKSRLKQVLIMGVIVLCTYFFIRFGVANILFTGVGIAPMSVLPLPVRLINIPGIILFYFGTFLFPLHLALARESYITDFSIDGFFLPIFALAAGLLGVGYAYKKSVKGKEDKLVIIFFCAWTIFTLLPYLQIFSLSATYAERWFYVAEVGLLGVFGAFIKQLSQNKYFPYLIVCILLLLSTRTIVRNFDWKSDATFFRHEVLINPNSYAIQSQLGMVLALEGNDDQAEHHFLRAVQLFPQDPIAKINLGGVYERRRDFPKSVQYFKESLVNYPTKIAFERVSTMQIVSGQWQEAEEIVLKGLQMYPKSSQLRFNLGLINYNRKDLKNAISEIKKGYELSGEKMYLDVIKKIEQGQELQINY